DCGKQVYLGGFDTAYMAARAYDKVAIRFRGAGADINFNLSDYVDDLKQMGNLTKEEFVHILRQQCTAFSRASSKYRGVTLHKSGRWESRMVQIHGKKASAQTSKKRNAMEAVNIFDKYSLCRNELHATKNESVEQNLDLSLGLSSPIVGCTLVAKDNKKNPVLGINCNPNTHVGSHGKKVRHMKTT
ncbi:hypothetical protein KI387_030617, partial [Taxus chinensis]